MIGRVIGLGQRSAGDDGVGPAVLDRLRLVAPLGVELVEIADASAVIPLLATPRPIVIVDAVVVDGAQVGRVIEVDADVLPRGMRSASTHGVGLGQALSIGRLLAARDADAATVRLVAVVIDQAVRGTIGLSRRVEQAIPLAAAAVCARLRRSR